MLEARQDAALGVEALELGDRPGVQELDGGALFEAAVGAPSLEDLTHAAAADAPDELPWTEPQCAPETSGSVRPSVGRAGCARKLPIAAAERSKLFSSACNWGSPP